MDEFEFIRRHLAPLAGEGAHDLADDAARLPGGWVISTDTSIAGVHFPPAVRGAAAAERAVRVAASDLAAKAAEPYGYFVNLSLPRDMQDQWLVAMAAGLQEAQTDIGLHLLGGDTTRHDGPLGITVTVVGREERTLLRSGASVGDDVWVSGPIGDSLLGLKHLQGATVLDTPTGEDIYRIEEAFLRPTPRFDLVPLLRDVATASIDISDGLMADAGHIAEASSVGIDILAASIPLSDTVARWATDEERLIRIATAGDDYQVLFTAHPSMRERTDWMSCTRIGEVAATPGVRLRDADGGVIKVGQGGYRH